MIEHIRFKLETSFINWTPNMIEHIKFRLETSFINWTLNMIEHNRYILETFFINQTPNIIEHIRFRLETFFINWTPNMIEHIRFRLETFFINWTPNMIEHIRFRLETFFINWTPNMIEQIRFILETFFMKYWDPTSQWHIQGCAGRGGYFFFGGGLSTCLVMKTPEAIAFTDPWRGGAEPPYPPTLVYASGFFHYFFNLQTNIILRQIFSCIEKQNYNFSNILTVFYIVMIFKTI